MDARRRTTLCLSVMTLAAVISPAAAQPQPPAAGGAPPAAPGGQAAAPAGVQVLDQGPIHEAFAEPVVLDARPRVIVDREPPEPINELPPEVQPDGANVQWIPGYWMWSDIKQDFIWVSGVWRDVPPGRRWVPGHWLKDGVVWQWVSGFWAGADVQEVRLLPHPPATLEAGPNIPAPGDNFFWIPGAWIWNNGAYAWRAGYWYAGQPGWVWIPDYYCYTPAGSIFVAGYWDRPLWNRGLLFAPVWWPAQRFGFPAWSYRPQFAIDASLLLGSLYINVRQNFYWYGRGRWNRDDFCPWWDRRGGWPGYDPFWAYHRWHDGRRGDWDDHWRGEFDRRERELAVNPPAFGDVARSDAPRAGQSVSRGLIADLSGQRQGRLGDVRFHGLSSESIAGLRAQSERWSRMREARIAAETGGGSGDIVLQGAASAAGAAVARPGASIAGAAGNGTGAAAARGRSPNARRLLDGTAVTPIGGAAEGGLVTGPADGATSRPGASTASRGDAGAANVQRRSAYRSGGFRLPALDGGATLEAGASATTGDALTTPDGGRPGISRRGGRSGAGGSTGFGGSGGADPPAGGAGFTTGRQPRYGTFPSVQAGGWPGANGATADSSAGLGGGGSAARPWFGGSGAGTGRTGGWSPAGGAPFPAGGYGPAVRGDVGRGMMRSSGGEVAPRGGFTGGSSFRSGEGGGSFRGGGGGGGRTFGGAGGGRAYGSSRGGGDR